MSPILRWVPCELHAHSVHSDGGLAVEALADAASRAGLECIALSDHNTVSGHAEIAEASKGARIGIVRAMEWTTFFGHLVVLGTGEYVDWRCCGPDDIQDGIERIHRAGGLAGLAHPYRAGSPFCTGCHWDFRVRDWSALDYLEVWSESSPQKSAANAKAFALWDSLLDRGIRIPGVSGRDWHGSGAGADSLAVTWLGIDRPLGGSQEELEAAVKDAIRSGRVSVSLEPLLVAERAAPRPGSFELDVRIESGLRLGRSGVDPGSLGLVLATNLGRAAELRVDGAGPHRLVAPSANLRWARAELYGSVGEDRALVAFANPEYLDA